MSRGLKERLKGCSGQSTVEYALALAAGAAVFVGLAAFWRFVSGAAFAEGVIGSLMGVVPKGMVYAALM